MVERSPRPAREASSQRRAARRSPSGSRSSPRAAGSRSARTTTSRAAAGRCPVARRSASPTRSRATSRTCTPPVFTVFVTGRTPAASRLACRCARRGAARSHGSCPAGRARSTAAVPRSSRSLPRRDRRTRSTRRRAFGIALVRRRQRADPRHRRAGHLVELPGASRRSSSRAARRSASRSSS